MRLIMGHHPLQIARKHKNVHNSSFPRFSVEFLHCSNAVMRFKTKLLLIKVNWRKVKYLKLSFFLDDNWTSNIFETTVRIFNKLIVQSIVWWLNRLRVPHFHPKTSWFLFLDPWNPGFWRRLLISTVIPVIGTKEFYLRIVFYLQVIDFYVFVPMVCRFRIALIAVSVV